MIDPFKPFIVLIRESLLYRLGGMLVLVSLLIAAIWRVTDIVYLQMLYQVLSSIGLTFGSVGAMLWMREK